MSDITGVGMNSPTNRYDQSISEMFPNPTRRYKIESSIASKYDRDFLPVNANLFNGGINDSFLEFNVEGIENSFLDLSHLTLEMKVQFTNANNTAIEPAKNLSLVDGFFHRMFKSHSVFLNGTQVEASNNFGLLNNIKTFTNMSKMNIDTIGRGMFYKNLDIPIPNTLATDYFEPANIHQKESDIVRESHGVVQAVGPLLLGISDADQYLLDKISMRVRLDLAPASVLINSNDTEEFKYFITSCKLWVRVVNPVPSSLIAINKMLFEKQRSIEYVFERPLEKTIIFPQNHSTLTIDSPFGSIIPHKLFIFIIDQTALNGSYRHNANYLTHNNISNIKVDINGNSLSNHNCAFPREAGSVFYQTLSTIGKNNLLTYNNFRAGRTIFCFDTRTSDASDSLSIERQGMLRISINCRSPSTSNKVVFVIGFTTGILEVTGDRRIFPNFLQ